jgi:hypothetical protein
VALPFFMAAIDGQIRLVCKNAFFHLRRISQLKKFLSKAALAQLIHAFVISRLDYCNSLLADLSRVLWIAFNVSKMLLLVYFMVPVSSTQSTPFSLICIGSSLCLELTIRLPYLLIVV